VAGEWKLVHRFWESAPRLYRIADDPGENQNLASQHPDKTRELMSLHAQWKERHYPNPIPRDLNLSRYRFPDEPPIEPTKQP
jgi:hypothetical protein